MQVFIFDMQDKVCINTIISYKLYIFGAALLIKMSIHFLFIKLIIGTSRQCSAY